LGSEGEIDAGHGPAGALTTEEREELGRLRRENRTLRMESDILKNFRARRGPSHLLDEKLGIPLR
jgi:transposase-like protein